MSKMSFEEVKATVIESYFRDCLSSEYKADPSNEDELQNIHFQFEKTKTIEELACVLNENGYQDYEAYEFIITALMNN